MKSNPKIDKDDRFKKISTDPKFKEIPRKVKKLEIKDSRFTSMFTSKSFNEGLDFDMYGRKVDKKKHNNKKEFERYYMMDKPEEAEEDEEVEENIEEDDINADIDQELNADEDLSEDGETNNNIQKIKLPNEDGEYDSDTSEEFEQFLEERNAVDVEDPFQEAELKSIPNGEETKRISVMNIDWENIHASDLFVLFNSFCKGKSKVIKVEIYPSEFGIVEIEREQREGPSKEIFEEVSNRKLKKLKNKSKHTEEDREAEIIHHLDDAVDDQSENIDGVNPLKLRKYELRKLKYYYAVVHFDSKETAMGIYSECDGMEIERTQSFMDLRFVPDELIEFPYKPKEMCDSLPGEYNPKFHPNSALQHSKVKLTWEGEDPKRNELISKAFSKQNFNQEEIQQLLMSSDSETDEDAKLFAEEMFKDTKDDEGELNLLKRKRNKDLNIKEGETIEITFNKGFEGINENISINKAGTKDRSMWETYMDKKKNIRREKKIEERHIREDKKTKRYKKEDEGTATSASTANKKELNLLVDNSLKNKSFTYNNVDNRFVAISKDTRYAVDPTSKEFKNKNK